MNKKERMYERIRTHGENLNRIFDTEYDPVTLCKKLRRLELKAHHATTCLCNTNTLDLLELNRFTGRDVHQATEEEQDAFFDKIKARLLKILGPKAHVACFINYDPRGYALKIKDSYIQENNIKIDQDWGGYGILAPDYSE